jgi:Zinc knuckle
MKTKYLLKSKLMLWIRPQTGLAASAPDPHATPGRSGDRHFEGSDLTSREREAEAKRSQQVSQRFPEEVKYTGAPDADLAKVLGKMRDCITDLSLTPAESRKYAHNLFTDDAKRFFDDDKDIKAAATLDCVIELMLERFISSAARTSTEANLEGLQIARVTKEDRKSPRDALTFICREIVTKNPLCTTLMVGDRQKAKLLKRAVLSDNWAAKPCEDFNQDEAMTFTKLEQKLTAALIHAKEAEDARAKALIATSESHYAASATTPYYGGRYGGTGSDRESSHNVRSSQGGRGRKTWPTKLRPRNQKSRDCWRCGKPGHIAANCRAPSAKTLMEAVRGRVKSLGGDDQAVAETLLELVEDLQDDTETKEILPTNLFETMLEQGEEEPSVSDPGNGDTGSVDGDDRDGGKAEVFHSAGGN